MMPHTLSLPPLPLWHTSAPYARALLILMAAEAGKPDLAFGGLIEQLGGRSVALRHLAWARAHTCMDISESDYVTLRGHAIQAGESEAATVATVWVQDAVARLVGAVKQQRQTPA